MKKKKRTERIGCPELWKAIQKKAIVKKKKKKKTAGSDDTPSIIREKACVCQDATPHRRDTVWTRGIA